jgi:sporulation-control protein spo0M
MFAGVTISDGENTVLPLSARSPFTVTNAPVTVGEFSAIVKTPVTFICDIETREKQTIKTNNVRTTKNLVDNEFIMALSFTNYSTKKHFFVEGIYHQITINKKTIPRRRTSKFDLKNSETYSFEA